MVTSTTTTTGFFTRDPIGYEARDANLYRYVENQVTTHIDPSGLIDDAKFDRLARAIRDMRQPPPLRTFRERQNRSFRDLEVYLKGVTSSEQDNGRVDDLIEHLRKVATEIERRGGPQRFNYFGPVCTNCALLVETNFPHTKLFDFESKVKEIGPDHNWSEITTGCGEKVTIDFWAVGTDDFWRVGENGFGWIADEDR